jgi:uncharacterized protein (DUF342 family)
MPDIDRVIAIVDDKVNKLDGYYSLQIKETGIYLTVQPPQNEGMPVQESVIMQDLASRNISQIIPGMIAKVITEAKGDAIKIAEVATVESDPEIIVLVSRDRMESTLTIKKPPRCRPVLIDEVLAALYKAGVVCGIDRAAVEQAMEKPGSRVVCASGIAVQNGKDATITLLFDKNAQARPVERENGTVDFKNLQLFTTVVEGGLLAEKVPATAGIAGMDVLGHDCIPKPGKDIPLPIGKNVYQKDDKVFASIAGQVVYNKKKIHVMPVIKINGDVDLSTGNIDFVGSIVVSGSVQAGFTVKAGGDIEITGTLCGGMVEAQNIIVRMGIQGMHRGYIRAVENVVAKFIENATVVAGNEVIVSDVILHSQVSAGKRVIVEGRRGLIVGGTISAGEEIQAKNAGTRMAISTELEVGVNPLLREESQNLRCEIQKVRKNLEQAKKALTILKSMKADTLSSDKKAMLLKLTKAQFHLMGQESTMNERIAEIDVMLDEMRYGKIKISEVVFPGVKIVVGTLVKPIREIIKFAAFFQEDGEIKVGSFR